MSPTLLAWGIAALAVAGVVARPFDWPEAIWAAAGAAALVLLGLLPPDLAWTAVGKGTDVYLFLVGMMLLSEVGRREGLFDWVAVLAVNHARGSPRRLFFLVYAVGVAITTFLSNDATAVVLTPAVFAVARKARTKPLPLLFACALVANAASFVLPISNPANLVLYGNHTPALGDWLARFALPSALSIGATFLVLRWSQRRALDGACAANLETAPLTAGGRVSLAAIGVTAVVLMAVSSLDLPLGLPTALLGVLATVVVLLRARQSPWPILTGVSWSVLPLVAALFVLVEVLDHTGVIRVLATLLATLTAQSETAAAAGAGIAVAIAGNVINNLPAGLIASSTLVQAHSPAKVVDAMLIGIDLGPNLSVTGSLATILWLAAIRREGERVGFFAFLAVGSLAMLPALLLALAARLAMGG